MTTKNPGKPPVEHHGPVAGPAPADMRAAYEIHTLAQMMYGQIARTNPWMSPMSPMTGHDPYTSHSQAHWTPQWPVAWNAWTPWWGR